jgi:GAF domain-containing protein/HAMP domain-containing protein
MEQRKRLRRPRLGINIYLAPKHWPIFYKILVSILLVVVLALAATTIVNALTIQDQLQHTIGASLRTQAQSDISRLANILAEQLTILQNIALINEIQTFAATKNAQYAGDLAFIERQLLSYDELWDSAGDESELVQDIIDPQRNLSTAQLINYKETFPNHYKLLFTDRYGAVLAATERPDDYYQAEQEWWQAAYNNGEGALYISQPWNDRVSGDTALSMAAPIYAESGQVSGVVLTTFRMSPIYQVVRASLVGNTGRAVLLDAERFIIAAPTENFAERLGDQVPFSWGEADTLQQATGQRNLVDARGVDALAGHAAISGAEIEQVEKAQAIHQLGWALFILQAESEAYRPVSTAVRTGLLAAGAFVLVALVLAYVVGRMMTSPITRLLDAARQMTSGDLSARAVVLRRDETGQLARAFNAMAEELAHTVDSLEQRVQERTRNLQTAAEVSHATTALLNPDELLRQVVDLVRDRFRLYYVGLFLVDDQRRYAVLQAGTGRAGQEMLAQGHRREVGDESMIGRCVARGEAQIAFDTDERSTGLDNPHLPETRSKMALPLRSRGRVIGGMSVQSTEPQAFDDAHVAVMQTVADQVAVAIDNAHLFTETEAALEEAEATYQRYVRQAWAQYAPTIPSTHYETRRRGAALLGDQVLPEVQQALERQGTVMITGDGQTQHSALVAPVTLRGGEIIGALGVHDDEGTRQWTRDDVALIEAITERLGMAAENLRLFDQTRRRAAREQLAHEITDRMRSAIDLDNLLQVTIREMSTVLDTSSAFVQLAVPTETTSEEEDN